MTLGNTGIEHRALGVGGGEINSNCKHRKSFLGRGEGINMKHCFTLTTSEEKNDIKTLKYSACIQIVPLGCPGHPSSTLIQLIGPR